MSTKKYPKYPLGKVFNPEDERATDEDLETRHVEAVKVPGSSAIHRIDFTDQDVLIIYMNDGSKLEYGGVPKSLFDAFQKAPSKGKFFNAHIRNIYQHLN